MVAAAVDLCIVSDATGSMGAFLNAVRSTVPQFIDVARLTNAFQRVGVCAVCALLLDWFVGLRMLLHSSRSLCHTVL